MEQEEEVIVEELTEEQLKKRRYVRIAAFSVLAVIILTGFMCAFTGGSDEPTAKETAEAAEAKPGVVNLIELSKVKNIPIQYYNAGIPLIANTPEELLVNLKLDGWSSQEIPLSLGYSRVFSDGTKKVSTWMRVYSSRDKGREQLYDTLKQGIEDSNIIVSENSDIGSGGFITNDGSEIVQWFYYEPNIVARASMLKSQGGTLKEVTDWAHRINYSIYSVLD